MRTRYSCLLLVGLAAGVTDGLWQAGSAEGCGNPMQMFSQQAVYGDDAARTAAIARLRKAGPGGLQALVETHSVLLESLRTKATPDNLKAQNRPQASLTTEQERALWNPVKEKPQAIHSERLRTALDEVAQQRGAHNSLLFWYTDLEAAKVEAKRTQRPILSLRLLGKLTDEYSCANSRFFRTVLYANKEVAGKLRDTFVLHWSTERPVPVVTVDFGDGRVLKRTMMGNSAHYVLDFNGRPVDVVPGLYGPKAFLKVVGSAAVVASEVAPLSDTAAAGKLAAFHKARLEIILAAWNADLAKVGGGKKVVSPPRNPGDGNQSLSSRFYGPLTNDFSLSARTTDEDWTRIAALHLDDARLDETGKALIRNEKPAGPPAPDAMRVAVCKMAVEMPMLRAAQAALQFERNVALDSVRNEYLLHSTIHEWFVRGMGKVDFAGLNQRVYAELFLTPANDPWMGLAPAVYTGLEGAGMSISAR